MDKFFIFIAMILICVSVKAENDPTRPQLGNFSAKKSVTLKKPSKQKSLTAIFKRNGKKIAIIGDKIYRVGDRYQNTKIVSIKTNSVHLKGVNGLRKLTLIPKIKSK